MVFWACALPVCTFVLATVYSPWWLTLAFIYPAKYVALVLGEKVRRGSAAQRYCLFLMLGHWAGFAGQMLFVSRKLRRRDEVIIEYKSAN